MLRTTMLHRFLLVSLFVLMTASQPGSVSAGINVWTSNGPEGGSISSFWQLIRRHQLLSMQGEKMVVCSKARMAANTGARSTLA